MYIDFMDILRDIKNGIYPNVSQWRDESEQFKNEAEQFKNNAMQYAELSKDNAGTSLENSKNSESWANEDVGKPVNKWTYDAATDSLSSVPVTPEQYSAKHWAAHAKEDAQIEAWRAEAAKMTAYSFSNEAANEPVKIYTSNDDGTFTESTLEYVFSALHYRQDTEDLTGHKRWVETQTAVNGQQIFGFQKNINHADVYLNGKRQIDGVDYNRLLKDITFISPLNDGDTVTVSGMEAITGDEFQTILEENKVIQNDVKLKQLETQASEMTAQSFASEPLDQFVKIYTSNGDGTFSAEETNFYSALHWSIKMNLTLAYMVIVDTYHDLELLNVNDAKTVYVRGGYELNDGREGFFRFVPENSSINNDGTIIDGWTRIYDGPMNLKWFGVKPDGSDVASKINNALQWSDEIKIDSGTYVTNSTILIDNKKIYANDVTFESQLNSGITIVNVKNNNIDNGIFGNLHIKFIVDNYSAMNICLNIENSSQANYNVSFENGTVGLNVETSDQSQIIKMNTFNIVESSNCDASVLVSQGSDNTILNNDFYLNYSIAFKDSSTSVLGTNSHIVQRVLSGVSLYPENNNFKNIYAVNSGSFNKDIIKIYGTSSVVEVSDISIDSSQNQIGYMRGDGNSLFGYSSNIANLIDPLDSSSYTYYNTIVQTGSFDYRDLKNGSMKIVSSSTDPIVSILRSGSSGTSLYVNGDTTTDGNEIVNGSTTLNGNAEINGQTLINGDLSVSSNASISGTLTISQLVTSQNNMNINGNLNVSGLSALSGNVNMQQLLDVSGNVHMYSDVQIDGNATINGAINTSGNISTSNVYSTGQITSGTSITVDNGTDSSIMLPSSLAVNSGTISVLLDGNGLDISDSGSSKFNVDINGDLSIGSKRIVWSASAAPTSGTWNVGDIVYNSSPASGGYIGWVCTVAGTPGTWNEFGSIV